MLAGLLWLHSHNGISWEGQSNREPAQKQTEGLSPRPDIGDPSNPFTSESWFPTHNLRVTEQPGPWPSPAGEDQTTVSCLDVGALGLLCLCHPSTLTAGSSAGGERQCLRPLSTVGQGTTRQTWRERNSSLSSGDKQPLQAWADGEPGSRVGSCGIQQGSTSGRFPGSEARRSMEGTGAGFA